MISPDEVTRRAERWWTNGSLLRAWLGGTLESLFPKAVPQIGLTKAADKEERFVAIWQEQESLQQGAKPVISYGYSLEWTMQNSRGIKNLHITRIYIETPPDWLRLIGKETAFGQFSTLANLTRQRVPELEPWLCKYPLRLLEHAPDWPDLLTVCRFFIDTYEPNRYYVRQLPLPVHTKFLEERSSLLLSLLSVIRPALIRSEHKDWRKRLGLLVPEPMVRVRVGPAFRLDDALRLDGKHDDFGLPLSAFARHVQPAERIFICENLLNFLTLPAQPNAVAIWSGGGFNIQCLAGVEWLCEKQLVYWGDLDAQGFQILNQCRGYFPNTRALLMDQATFEYHYDLKGDGEKTDVILLPHLTDDERALFNRLKFNNWRVEQERLDGEWVAGAFSKSMTLSDQKEGILRKFNE